MKRKDLRLELPSLDLPPAEPPTAEPTPMPGELDPLLKTAVNSQPEVKPPPQPTPEPQTTPEPNPAPQPPSPRKSYGPLIVGGVALLIGLSTALLGGKPSGNGTPQPRPNPPQPPSRNDWA